MTIQDILLTNIPPLRTSMTGAEAMLAMHEHMVMHLPIVNNEQLLGVIAYEDIEDEDVKEPLGSYNLSLNKAYIRKDESLMEAIRLLGSVQLTVLPVVNENHEYLGVIRQQDLLYQLSQMSSFNEPGAAIILMMKPTDYSPSEITRIAEAEGVKVLSLMVHLDTSTQMLRIFLKFNKQNIEPVISAYIRFGYDVRVTYAEEDYQGHLQDRYDSLMHYLNV